jgi:hypothetical protein
MTLAGVAGSPGAAAKSPNLALAVKGVAAATSSRCASRSSC